MKTTTKKLVGYVGVDSGQVMITDPCYLGKFKAPEDCDGDLFNEENKGKYSYSGACVATLSEDQAGQLDEGVTGVAVSSGYGDGSYPVYVEYSDEGEWGVRIKSVTVEFFGDEDEQEAADII